MRGVITVDVFLVRGLSQQELTHDGIARQENNVVEQLNDAARKAGLWSDQGQCDRHTHVSDVAEGRAQNNGGRVERSACAGTVTGGISVRFLSFTTFLTQPTPLRDCSESEAEQEVEEHCDDGA